MLAVQANINLTSVKSFACISSSLAALEMSLRPTRTEKFQPMNRTMTTTDTRTIADSADALWAAHGGFRDIFDLAGAAISALENGNLESTRDILIALAYRADQGCDAAEFACSVLEGDPIFA